jgi:hypothetical protein
MIRERERGKEKTIMQSLGFTQESIKRAKVLGRQLGKAVITKKQDKRER